MDELFIELHKRNNEALSAYTQATDALHKRHYSELKELDELWIQRTRDSGSAYDKARFILQEQQQDEIDKEEMELDEQLAEERSALQRAIDKLQEKYDTELDKVHLDRATKLKLFSLPKGVKPRSMTVGMRLLLYLLCGLIFEILTARE